VAHQLNYRRPTQEPQSEKPRRTFGEKIVAQWPFFLGLGSIGAGLLVIRATFESGVIPGRRGGARLGMYLIAFGVVMILYWAFASDKSGDYNF
jgi:hypothetical protein